MGSGHATHQIEYIKLKELENGRSRKVRVLPLSPFLLKQAVKPSWESGPPFAQREGASLSHKAKKCQEEPGN